MAPHFVLKKGKILQELSRSDGEYADLSPKGTIDDGIRDLIDRINATDGFVTTSSCAGRIAVYLEGMKKLSETPSLAEAGIMPEKPSAAGWKGGGEWLYVSHKPVDCAEVLQRDEKQSLTELCGLGRHTVVPLLCPLSGVRFVHLKFEPMILHILTSSLGHASRVLSAAMSAGFRESGISSIGRRELDVATPLIAVRSSGLAFDCIIGYEDASGKRIAMVSEDYLSIMIAVANERFQINAARRGRFEQSLFHGKHCDGTGDGVAVENSWEPTGIRSQRKREEGLRRQREVKDMIAQTEKAAQCSEGHGSHHPDLRLRFGRLK